MFSDPSDRSMWEIALIVVVMTPTNHPPGALAIGVVGDGDTRGQRHPEWGSTRGRTQPLVRPFPNRRYLE